MKKAMRHATSVQYPLTKTSVPSETTQSSVLIQRNVRCVPVLLKHWSQKHPELKSPLLHSKQLPANPELQDEWEDDDLLIKVLEDIEKQNSALTPPANPAENTENKSENAVVPVTTQNILTVNNVANVANMSAGPSRMPVMYFLHSNVTINYNFKQ